MKYSLCTRCNKPINKGKFCNAVCYHSHKKGNKYILDRDKYKIVLPHKKGDVLAIIDKCQFDKVKNYTWGLHIIRYHGEQYTREYFAVETLYKGKRVSLSQFLLGKKDGYFIDHKNGNPLDNRLDNLRYATRQQNTMNRFVTGVDYDKRTKKYRARIMVNGKIITDSGCDSKKDAVAIRKSFEKKYFGEYARSG